jgi:V/A-type H+-transporting ATPase subunit E
MAEDLQSLIDRIQQDGLAKAEGETQRMVAAAQEQAAKLIQDAEAQAKARVERADRDSQIFVERGNKALEQAARDVILSVHQAVSETLDRLVLRTVGEVLTLDVIKQMMVKVVEAYCARQGDCTGVDLLVAPSDQKKIVEFFLQEFRSAIDKGVEIHVDSGLGSGFRVSIEGTQVHHDFTPKEIAAALSKMLRPRLAEIVKAAAKP